MLTVELDRLRLGAGDRVIDIGCGEGRHCHGVQMLTPAAAVGVDLDTAALAVATERAATLPVAAQRARFEAADATRLPYDDGSFAAAICSEVLEHVPDWQAVAAEAARLVRPGGVFAVSVPRAWPERLCWRLAPGAGGYADQPGGHIRIFDVRALERGIVAAGFRATGRGYAHALHTPYWWLKTALWRRRDDHVLVRAYHRLLVWDMTRAPWPTRTVERLLNPVMGKSVVLYFERT